MGTIVITENVWRNSQFSIAAHFGRIQLNGHEFVIVDKRGHDIFECSLEAEKAGRTKAIEPGEPADLCRTDFVPIYRKLGRDKFLEFLNANPDVDTVRKAKDRLKTWQRK